MEDDNENEDENEDENVTSSKPKEPECIKRTDGKKLRRYEGP